MLADDVGWRAHLKIVDEVVIRDEVGVPVLDDVAGISTEEQRFGRAARATGRELQRRLHVVPQRQDALLWEMPAGLVESDVELNRRGFVATDDLLVGDRIDIDWLAIVVDGGIGKRRTELWTKRQTIDDESGRRRVLRHGWRTNRRRWTRPGGAVRQERCIAALAEEL